MPRDLCVLHTSWDGVLIVSWAVSDLFPKSQVTASFLGSLPVTALTFGSFRKQTPRVRRARGSLGINDWNRKKGSKQDWAEKAYRPCGRSHKISANPTGALELRLPIRTLVLGRSCLSYGSAYSTIGSEIAWERCGLSLKAEMCPEGGNSRRLSVTCTPCSWIASSFSGDLGHLYDRYVPQSNATDFCGEIDIIFTILTILFI